MRVVVIAKRPHDTSEFAVEVDATACLDVTSHLDHDVGESR
jgi:hypothetical protein